MNNSVKNLGFKLQVLWFLDEIYHKTHTPFLRWACDAWENVWKYDAEGNDVDSHELYNGNPHHEITKPNGRR